MASNDIGDWYRGIPQITKYWFTGSIVLPLIGRFGFVNAMNLVLDYNSIVYRFQVVFHNSVFILTIKNIIKNELS